MSPVKAVRGIRCAGFEVLLILVVPLLFSSLACQPDVGASGSQDSGAATSSASATQGRRKTSLCLPSTVELTDNATATTPAVTGERTGHRYVFCSINVPGASSGTTAAFGLNNHRQIVGAYNDGRATRGFLLANGIFQTIDVAGALGTVPVKLNDSGTIVGLYLNPGGHGFVLTSGQFTTLDAPGAGFTQAFGINERGDIVGDYGGPEFGFLLSNGSFESIAVPGATGNGAEAVNDRREVVGNYASATGLHAYLLKDGVFRDIAFPGASVTTVRGINNRGDIVGGAAGHAYVLNGSVFRSIDVPDASSSEAMDIDDQGDVVGIYTDATGYDHGFVAIRTPHLDGSGEP